MDTIERLHRIAENIVGHIKPNTAHGERLADVEVVQSMLALSLTQHGFVRIEKPNGEALLDVPPVEPPLTVRPGRPTATCREEEA